MVSYRAVSLVALVAMVVPVTSSNAVDAVLTQVRRTLNFSSLLGSSKTTRESPYDLIAGQPVFQVTTAWGAPYMNFEKVVDKDDSANTDSKEFMDEDRGTMRPVALFFMDPDDALQLQIQMKQMGNMQDADMRITTTTMAKALRQSANLGNGLVTGAPPEPNDGKLKSMNEGGSLRYKIVPPQRQLFYAARCKGRERIGQFFQKASGDAEVASTGFSRIASVNLSRLSGRSQRSFDKMTPEQQESAHMEGYTGIPVFYAPEMKRVLPKVKQLTSGNKEELPMFFNYEDLMEAWGKLRKGSKANIPAKPSTVEVFNMWDVLTSIEKNDWSKKKGKVNWRKDPMVSIRDHFSKEKPGLDDITFVPSSRSVLYKEETTARGNGKARLRAMR